MIDEGMAPLGCLVVDREYTIIITKQIQSVKYHSISFYYCPLRKFLKILYIPIIPQFSFKKETFSSVYMKL